MTSRAKLLDPSRLHVSIRSSQYGGMHRHFDHRARRFRKDHEHWDWHYIVFLDGRNIYRSSNFCEWGRATRSLARWWKSNTV
jgi:hypothetical protein